MKTIVCIGPCCSGKSTWSLKYVEENDNCIRFSLDEFRIMTTGSLKSNRLDDKYINIMYNFLINLNLHHKDLIIDNLPLDINWFRMLIGSTSGDVEIKLFDIEFKESLLRNHTRKQKGGHSILIDEMHNYYIKYKNFLKSFEFRELIKSPRVSIIIDEFVNLNKQFIE